MPYLENDGKLVQRVKAGDEGAFDKLYCLYQNRVGAIVGRYAKDQYEAEDLIQVVFMKAFQGLGRFRGESEFTTWLTRIALNEGVSHLRAKRSHQNGLETVEQHMQEPKPLATPEDRVMKKERRQILTAGLRTLPRPYRRALRLRYVKDLSYKEIVRELNVPLGTVKVWLYRGRHQLKRELEKQDSLVM